MYFKLISLSNKKLTNELIQKNIEFTFLKYTNLHNKNIKKIQQKYFAYRITGNNLLKLLILSHREKDSDYWMVALVSE